MTKKQWIIGVTVMMAVGGAYGVYQWMQPAPTENAEAPSVAVATEKLEKRILDEVIDCYGVVGTDTQGVININVPLQTILVHLLVTPGQTVKKGESLAEVESDPQASLAYTQAQTTLETAHADYDRTKQLMGEQFATDSQLAAAAKALRDAQSAYDAQKKIGGDKSSQMITAPMDGTVTTITAAQGDHLAAGAPILQISSTNALRVELGIEPKDRARITPGMKVMVTPVFNKDVTLEGRITQVQNLINSASQLVTAYATIGKSDTDLMQGSAVRAHIIVASNESYVVPRNAVLNDDKGSYLFQISHEKAKRVNVTVGAESGGYVGVEGKLHLKRPVITAGSYELQDGMAVRDEKDETPNTDDTKETP